MLFLLQAQLVKTSFKDCAQRLDSAFKVKSICEICRKGNELVWPTGTQRNILESIKR